jgi:hypothetical protein
MKTVHSLGEGTKSIVLTGKGTVELAVESLKDYNVFHFIEKERFNKERFLAIVADAATHASYDQAALRLAGDLLSWFQDVELRKASSMLRTSLDDLKGIIRSLIADIAPVIARERAVIVKEGSNGMVSFDCWSKAYGSAVALRVADVSAVAEGELEEAICQRSLGNSIGFVRPIPAPYESFTSG